MNPPLKNRKPEKPEQDFCLIVKQSGAVGLAGSGSSGFLGSSGSSGFRFLRERGVADAELRRAEPAKGAFDPRSVCSEQAGAPLLGQALPADTPRGGLSAYVRSCNRCMQTGKQQAAGGFARVPWSAKQRWVCEQCLGELNTGRLQVDEWAETPPVVAQARASSTSMAERHSVEPSRTQLHTREESL